MADLSYQADELLREVEYFLGQCKGLAAIKLKDPELQAAVDADYIDSFLGGKAAAQEFERQFMRDERERREDAHG